ncbi:uncharacterized protein LOC126696272 [Quercus robur]|uniref:uncharacterized protein LOC126696272 n=1 Tax=Quercus robur TaxID=38942 RepID=UPI00216390C2|nr:uncharacterized protein LOC126696272 [Quercus robur]
MKFHADKHRLERSFSIGDWVYLRLQPYRQKSITHKTFNKLSPRFYSPFQVLQKIGAVAYKLDLPLGSQIHPVFHVSYLKAKLGQQVTPCSTLPAVNSEASATIPSSCGQGALKEGQLLGDQLSLIMMIVIGKIDSV